MDWYVIGEVFDMDWVFVGCQDFGDFFDDIEGGIVGQCIVVGKQQVGIESDFDLQFVIVYV